MLELGFGRLQTQELAEEIERGTVFEELKTLPHVRELLASMHTSSWFQVADSPEYLVVGKGGRQGCRYGGVIFNLGYARALKRLYAKAVEEDIPMRLRYTKNAAFGSDACLAAGTAGAIVFDVTFVDDEAFAVIASVPSSLMQKFQRAIILLTETFERYGMSINWKPGKTEAMIVLRGKNARAEKLKLVQHNGMRKLVFDKKIRRMKRRRTAERIEVNVVDQYKHLGCIIDSSGNLVPEARNRARSAMNSFAPLAKYLLGSKSWR